MPSPGSVGMPPESRRQREGRAFQKKAKKRMKRSRKRQKEQRERERAGDEVDEWERLGAMIYGRRP